MEAHSGDKAVLLVLPKGHLDWGRIWGGGGTGEGYGVGEPGKNMGGTGKNGGGQGRI